MGDMLFSLDWSLISDANHTMPNDLESKTNQISLIISLMPLGAVFGSLILGPSNEYLGRRGAIILVILFYLLEPLWRLVS
jgi:MFS family permease